MAIDIPAFVQSIADNDFKASVDIITDEFSNSFFAEALLAKASSGFRVRMVVDRGSDEILETVSRELGTREGEVTSDGRCSYIHFECLGSCDTAPMMMVDDQYHENLTPAKARKIVRGLD